MGADHSIPTSHDTPDTKNINLKQRPVNVPMVNNTFIEWVTDYDCLIKNDDLFGVLPSTNELQNSKNVFALMQTVYDILSNIVKIQANDIYKKSKRLAHFQDFKFYISDDSKLKLYQAIWKKFEDVVMLRDSSTMTQKTHHIQDEITDTSRSFNGFYAQHHTLAPEIKKESITHNLKQQPVYVPRVNKIFIEWVTDYDCLIKKMMIYLGFCQHHVTYKTQRMCLL